MSGEDVIVAVDGGNSKTDVALVADDGTLLSVVRGQGSSPHHLGLTRALRVVDDLVARAWFEAGLGDGDRPQARFAAVFMAGADLPTEEQALAQAATDLGWARETHVANDVHAILWAATTNGHGVAVTVGAGVNCVGRAPGGRTAWFPALGAITGDWGGGYDIGLAALGAGVRAEDRRGGPTSLATAVAAHFEQTNALDVAISIHQGTVAESRLIELPPIVLREAQGGDAVALSLVHRQADEVTALVIAAARQLGIEREPVDVVLGGGFLAASGALVTDRVRADVARHVPRAQVMLCTTRPVVGAAVAGLAYAGIDGSAADRLRAEWPESEAAPA